MITSKTYSSKLDQLLNGDVSYKDRLVNPDKEPVFTVTLNDRKIDVPTHFKTLATKGDHKAETIWFAMDRYFDGKDLGADTWDILVDSQTNKTEKVTVVWAVQFINALGEEFLHKVDYRSLDSRITQQGQDPSFYEEGEEGTFHIGWDIHYDLTKAAGKVTFSLRCYAILGGDIIYNISTEPATAFIKDGLYITEESNLPNPPKDNLSQLVATITALYKNTDLTNLNYKNIQPDTLPLIDGIRLDAQLNLDSSRLKIADYNNLKNTPVYSINGNELQDGVDLELLTEADSELKDSTNPIQNKPVFEKFNNVDSTIGSLQEKVENLQKELGEMTYVPLSIKSFTNNLNLCEKNTPYNGDITFNWEVVGNVKTLSLYNGERLIEDLDISSSKGTYTMRTNLTDTTTYKLLAVDPKDKSQEEISKVTFTYKVFYGTAAIQESYSPDFIGALEGSSLQETRETTFEVDADINEYIYFCLPKSYTGMTPQSFVFGVTAGGFGTGPIATVTYNKTEYNIWKSDQKGLGNTIIKVV